MNGNHIETLIVQNPRAGNGNNYELAYELNRRIPKAEVYSLSELEKGEIKNIPNKVILVGGDGTFRYVIEWFNQHDERPLIFLAGGGTGNILRRMLVEEQAVVTIEDLKDTEKLLEKTAPYKPGVIRFDLDHGPEEIFTVVCGFGDFELLWAKEMEKIRQKLGNSFTRIYGAGILSFISCIKQGAFRENSALHVYSLGRYVGPLKVFSDSEISLQSPNIGLLEVTDQNPKKAALKLAATLLLLQKGIHRIPKSFALKTYNVEFIETSQNGAFSANIDGDLRNFEKNGMNLTLRRNGVIFNAATLTDMHDK